MVSRLGISELISTRLLHSNFFWALMWTCHGQRKKKRTRAVSNQHTKRRKQHVRALRTVFFQGNAACLSLQPPVLLLKTKRVEAWVHEKSKQTFTKKTHLTFINIFPLAMYMGSSCRPFDRAVLILWSRHAHVPSSLEHVHMITLDMLGSAMRDSRWLVVCQPTVAGLDTGKKCSRCTLM